MATEFTYTSNHSPDQLSHAIGVNQTIVTDLDYITTAGDQLTLKFVSDLSTGEETELNAIMAGSLSAIPEIQLYNYVPAYKGDKTVPDILIDYKTGLDRRLYPQNVFRFGELQTIILHETQTPLGNGYYSFTTPVIKEEFVYVRDASGIPQSRTQTISWYDENGNPHTETKQRHKYYDGLAAMQELKRRRVNNVDLANAELIPLVMVVDPVNYTTSADVIADGVAFYNQPAVESARINYENHGDGELIVKVQTDNSKLPWADLTIEAIPFAAYGLPTPDVVADNPGSATTITIRDHIVYELSFGTIYPT